MKKQTVNAILFVTGMGFSCAGCVPQPAPGRSDQPRKTVYTQAEVEELKADGVSEAEIQNMGITIVD